MYERDSGLQLTAEEFELEVKKILDGCSENFGPCRIEHREVVHGMDGDYEIDITVRFRALNVDFLLLVECKRHKSPIKREMVQILHDRMRSVGAQKGILFSTSGFQRGAIEYASTHGIALAQTLDGKTVYETRSIEPPKSIPPWVLVPQVTFWLLSIGGSGNVSMHQTNVFMREGMNLYLTGTEK